MTMRYESADLLKAQYQALSRQMPVMYFILLSSAWALAATHIALAPAWLAVGVPAILTLGCFVRVRFWWNEARANHTAEEVSRLLKHVNSLASVIALAFTTWAALLIPYGDSYTKSHVAFFIAVSIISCMFCLMYLRGAAAIMLSIVNGGFIFLFASTGEPTFVAISINVGLVSLGMLTVLMVNHENFSHMIESRQQAEILSKANQSLANHDSLTNLPNRRAYFAYLENAFITAKASGSRLAVGIVDLDGFKSVNDFYGYSTGDKLLIEVGARLAALPTSHPYLIARLGGDEFAFVVVDAPDDKTLLACCEHVCASLRVPFILPDAIVSTSSSVGIAVYPETASSAAELFDRADYALYHRKRTKRGESTLFSATHDAEIHRDARIEQMLKKADVELELSVVFQPIVDARIDKTIGFEALARWANPVIGPVSPGLFIPIAERAGIVSTLTRPLLRKALAAAATWPSDVRLSFNLSPQDLNTTEGVLALVGIIEGSGVDARRVDLEITETAFAHDFEQVQRSIEVLRLLGCGISLDDFGTGYSSLSRLHALPLTKFKIDRSFVANLHINPAGYKIVKTMLALSRDMGLDCVIEGVETTEEMAALKDLGGILIQGYLYSPPMPEAAVSAFLRQNTSQFASV